MLPSQPPPRWRNWQTHYLEVVAPARAWRFKSSPGHFRTSRTALRSASTLKVFERFDQRNPSESTDDADSPEIGCLRPLSVVMNAWRLVSGGGRSTVSPSSSNEHPDDQLLDGLAEHAIHPQAHHRVRVDQLGRSGHQRQLAGVSRIAKPPAHHRPRKIGELLVDENQQRPLSGVGQLIGMARLNERARGTADGSDHPLEQLRGKRAVVDNPNWNDRIGHTFRTSTHTQGDMPGLGVYPGSF